MLVHGHISLRRWSKCNEVFLRFKHKWKQTHVFNGVFLSMKMKTEVVSKASTLSHIVGPWLLIIVQIRFSAFLTWYQCRLVFPQQLSLSKLYFFPAFRVLFLISVGSSLSMKYFFLSHEMSRFQESYLLHVQKNLWAFKDRVLFGIKQSQ